MTRMGRYYQSNLPRIIAIEMRTIADRELLVKSLPKMKENVECATPIFESSPRFTAFTAKRYKKYAVKIIFFSPHLRKFTAKPLTGSSAE